MANTFIEIEHKFIVGPQFSKDRFFKAIRALGPKEHYTVDVTDQYFCLQKFPQLIFRHRRDARQEQLTVKSLEKDPECRTEINLDLVLSKAPQGEAVRALMRLLSLKFTKTITKKVYAFYFDDCEIVFYRAAAGRRSINCVEFEARHPRGKKQALEIIANYEQALGFAGKKREKKTLPEIFFGKRLQ